MDRMQLRWFRYGLAVGVAVLASVAVIATVAWGTMSSPRYGAAWDFHAVPLTQSKSTGAGAPEYAAIATDGAGSRGVFAYKFTDEAVQEKELTYTMVSPFWRRLGGDYAIQIFLTPEDDTACTFRLCQEYLTRDAGELIGNTDSQCVDIPSPQTVTMHSVQLPLQPADSTCLKAVSLTRIYRNSSHANDTCDGKFMWLHVTGVIFEKSSPGSRQCDAK